MRSRGISTGYSADAGRVPVRAVVSELPPSRPLRTERRINAVPDLALLLFEGMKLHHARVAQRTERRRPKARAGGSNPSARTINLVGDFEVCGALFPGAGRAGCKTTVLGPYPLAGVDSSRF